MCPAPRAAASGVLSATACCLHVSLLLPAARVLACCLPPATILRATACCILLFSVCCPLPASCCCVMMRDAVLFFSAPRACGCLHAGCCSPPVFLNCYGGSLDFTFSLRAFNFPVTRCGVPCIFFTVQTQILVRAACPSTWLRTGLSVRRASLRTGLQEGGRVSRRASGRGGRMSGRDSGQGGRASRTGRAGVRPGLPRKTV